MKAVTHKKLEPKKSDFTYSTQRDTEMIRNYICLFPPINDNAPFKVQMQREDEHKEITVTYIEEKNGKNVKHSLNLQSPRTKEAMDCLGVSIEDCIVR